MEIQARLLAGIRHLIHNGEVTERGFARISGISQPHLHKVLKGSRTLSMPRFDSLLKALNCSLLDLFEEQELRSYLAWDARPQPACSEVALHSTSLGPGSFWTPDARPHDSFPVPCSLFAGSRRLAVVRLKHDPEMLRTLAGCNMGALELAAGTPSHWNGIYAVDRAADTVLRRIRRGSAGLYLVSDEAANFPLQWEPIPTLSPDGRPAILGRLVWLGQDRRPKSTPLDWIRSWSKLPEHTSRAPRPRSFPN